LIPTSVPSNGPSVFLNLQELFVLNPAPNNHLLAAPCYQEATTKHKLKSPTTLKQTPSARFGLGSAKPPQELPDRRPWMRWRSKPAHSASHTIAHPPLPRFRQPSGPGSLASTNYFFNPGPQPPYSVLPPPWAATKVALPHVGLHATPLGLFGRDPSLQNKKKHLPAAMAVPRPRIRTTYPHPESLCDNPVRG